jgi:hypothetical protein
MTTTATISEPEIEAQPTAPDTPRSSLTGQLRADAVQRRWHAKVISAVYDPDTGWPRSFTVRCPFCRGRHQHSSWGSTTFASPWCGTPGVYEIRWPATTAPTEQQPDDPDESS